jgi:2'-5' RNA ligase
MRLFTAIDIPEEVRARLEDLIRQLKPLARLSWCPAENLHITTKFIGEWPEERLGEIQQALARIKCRPFRLAIRGVGWFPSERSPRVLYAGIKGDASITKLAEKTERALAELGVPVEDRPYQAHLTLARIRDRVPLDALREALSHELHAAKDNFGSFRVDAQHLYLSRAGRYTRLGSYLLS